MAEISYYEQAMESLRVRAEVYYLTRHLSTEELLKDWEPMLNALKDQPYLHDLVAEYAEDYERARHVFGELPAELV